MAKNFASVLDSLRAAGDVKIQEVDSVYALNCDWLLEQFKYTQASLLALASKSGGPGDKQEQQVRAAQGFAVRRQFSPKVLSKYCDLSCFATEHCQDRQQQGSSKGKACLASRHISRLLSRRRKSAHR